MSLRCIFSHKFQQMPVSSETRSENDKEVWRKIYYCIVCVKCGELIDLPDYSDKISE